MHLYRKPSCETSVLVRRSYDRIAGGYDQAWTTHMRDLSLGMLERLKVPSGARCLDLACGTGFITGELAGRSGTRAIGVDASDGMLAASRAAHGHACDFVHADALEYLRACKGASFDVVTCGWALGYSRPRAVLRQIARVLSAGGRVGIIDNSLFSLAGVLSAACKVFAEKPQALVHAARVRFLSGPLSLRAAMRLSGLRVVAAWKGSRTYQVADGAAAIERLTATGAAAGFEFAATDADREAIFARFAEVMDEQGGGAGVAFTHRYLAAVGVRPC
ncbi:MAG: methyltransferase domain-containing protein [Planctomycetaceae bacterium]|nr:methyltransferase domain-containing protein [Planctomycetaceae bacterium]